MDCQDVQTQLDAWLTDELEEGHSELITEHVANCRQCNEFFRDLQSMRLRVYHAQGAPCPELDIQMKEVIQQIADERREACQASRSLTKAQTWSYWLLWAACAVLGVTLLVVLDTPWASRLFMVGVMMNLCALLLVPYVIKTHEEWNQA